MVAPSSDIGIRRTMTDNIINTANTNNVPCRIIHGSFSPSILCILGDRCESSICVFLSITVVSLSELKLIFDEVVICSARFDKCIVFACFDNSAVVENDYPVGIAHCR